MPRISARGALPNTPCRQKTIGIDVDSQYLVVALFDASQPTVPVHEYPNNPAGIADLTARALQFAPEIAAMESTGPYHAALYDALTQAGLFRDLKWSSKAGIMSSSSNNPMTSTPP